MEIIDERPEDSPAIHEVVVEAFGRDDEARLVDDLRRDGDLAISVVAKCGATVCGHVAFSALLSPAHGLALAPVAVRPSEQGKGVGASLVRVGIERARALGYDIIFVLGEPRYYERFGFTTPAAAPFPSAFAGPHFMALHLSDHKVAPAPVVYPDAFAKLR